MKILAVSDHKTPQLYNGENLRRQYHNVEMVISCGDIELDYLDFIVSVLSVPLFYVRGNHDERHTDNVGGINLHRQFEAYKGITMVGLEGSIRYNKSGVQYTNSTMTGYCLQLLPRLFRRRLLKGYCADLMVAHSPPFQINDATDYAHRGFKAFRWLIRWTRPRYFIHGHVDFNDRRKSRITQFFKTQVININPYQLIDLNQRNSKG